MNEQSKKGKRKKQIIIQSQQETAEQIDSQKDLENQQKDTNCDKIQQRRHSDTCYFEDIQNNTRNKATLEQSQNDQDNTFSFLQETNRNFLYENQTQKKPQIEISNNIGINTGLPGSEKHAYSISNRSNQQNENIYEGDELTFVSRQKEQISEDQTNTLSLINYQNQQLNQQKNEQVNAIKIQSNLHPYFENESEQENDQNKKI